MKQFTKLSGRFTASIIRMAFFLSILFVIPSFARHQLELKTVFSSGQSEIGMDTSARLTAFSINLNYLSEFKINPNVTMLLQDVYNGIVPLYGDSIRAIYKNISAPAPFQDRKTSSYNNAAIGMRFVGKGIAELSGRAFWYFDAPELGPARLDLHDYIPADSNYDYSGVTMKRRMLTQIEASWELPLGAVSLDLGTNLLTRHYERKMYWLNRTTYTDTIAANPLVDERELWTNLGFNYATPIDVDVTVDAMIKNNFGGYARDNIYRYEGGLRGSHSLPAQNRLNWVLSERLYNMKLPLEYSADPTTPNLKYDYMVHPYTRFMARDVCTLAWGLFLKGTVILDGGKNYFKDRYEGSLRKAWEGGSSIEGGYFAALRGLVPMQGCYARGTFRPIEPLALSGTIKNRWEYQTYTPPTVDAMASATPGKFNSALLSYNLEGSFAVVKDKDLIVGIDWNRYKYYSSDIYQDVRTDFPSRFDAYLGFRGSIR